jgi:hypothetical protein
MDECPTCGQELQIGSWPFCPHPEGYAVTVIDDTLEGGPRVIDFGADPVFVSSKSEWKRELAKRPDLVHVDRHDAAYYARHRKRHDEQLRDTK